MVPCTAAVSARLATPLTVVSLAARVGVYQAFIQFAGFMMGKAVSAFDAPWSNYPGNNFDGLVGGSGDVTAVNQLTYTAQFGNGVSGSVAVSRSDRLPSEQSRIIWVLAVFSTVPPSKVAPTASAIWAARGLPTSSVGPKVDQAWGVFQLSAAAHDNHAAYYGMTEVTGHPGDKWGWAVQAALQIKNIPTGAGDTINLQAVYTDGASRYNFQSLVSQNYVDVRRHQRAGRLPEHRSCRRS